ncbi:hypothetical protein JZ751_003620 [Albula glossodonta]|uniref:Uncharacterized protein n=1 Tax=Albula glossodonta TaxID=121402 RepID=A0A8T2NDH7_9TELE|nr:hypothetical protein JZ751_003620 [Albula glossodonta]
MTLTSLTTSQPIRSQALSSPLCLPYFLTVHWAALSVRCDSPLGLGSACECTVPRTRPPCCIVACPCRLINANAVIYPTLKLKGFGSILRLSPVQSSSEPSVCTMCRCTWQQTTGAPHLFTLLHERCTQVTSHTCSPSRQVTPVPFKALYIR